MGTLFALPLLEKKTVFFMDPVSGGHRLGIGDMDGRCLVEVLIIGIRWMDRAVGRTYPTGRASVHVDIPGSLLNLHREVSCRSTDVL